jgi:murein DD-endopeptidase MepM/ murein hydrolase activator NlpD
MAYLTAKYQDFTYAGVESELRSLFGEQYQLAFTESIETRYADPDDANEDGDYEPYDWRVMTVTLTARSFADVVYSRMSAEQRQHYDMLMRSRGARQYLANPLPFGWLPYVTSSYGWRVHPISGEKNYHKGIDIGIPTGTEIRAGQDGVISVGYDAGGYGNYVTITDSDGLVSKYAHLDSALVSDGQSVKTGDLIAKSGNSGNSTGPHLHLEVIKNGQYLNPAYFSDCGSYPAGPVYGNPGAPMGDGSYAALIAEAERFLGYKYVWGGSSPATSFDCSGYISYILRSSGVKNVGRLGAQGLYNICTPIPLSEAMPGDLIFFTKTYSVPNHVTHVGLYVGEINHVKTMIHCGNPLQYTSIETDYWQNHFYAVGRINP